MVFTFSFDMLGMDSYLMIWIVENKRERNEDEER